MGLFKRNAETRQQLDALRSELFQVRQRLEETELAKRRLAEQVVRLGAGHDLLTSQVGDVETKVASVERHVVTVAGSIGPAIDSAVAGAASTADVEQLRNEMTRLGGLATKVDELRAGLAAQQLAAANASGPTADDHAALQQRLDELSTAIARQREQIADVALVATDSAERTDIALGEMRALAEPTDDTPARDLDAEMRAHLGQLAEKVGAIDSRVNQVSLELTNQLTELSGDLDRASAQADAAELIEKLTTQLDDVTDGQERLATEQARYAIQFREDLAELADRVRRPGTR
jgi:chromosome segregation ATPase